MFPFGLIKRIADFVYLKASLNLTHWNKNEERIKMYGTKIPGISWTSWKKIWGVEYTQE